MKPQFVFIYALAALLLGGCSRMSNVIIVNITDAPISVEYTVDVSQSTNTVFPAPREKGILFYTTKKDGQDFEKTANIPNKTLRVDTLTNYVSFQLFPNELVEIGDMGNYNMSEDKFVKFNLKNIKITTKDSLILYAEGDNTRHLFHYNKSSGKQLVFE